MFSPLSKGFGYWSGEYKLFTDNSEEQECAPFLQEPELNSSHRHGITVSPRSKSACSTYSTRSKKDAKSEGALPKTFLTRKGALLLFSAPDDHCIKARNEKLAKSRKHKELIDLSLKLRTVDRLSLSVLQYGDQGSIQREDSSITDPENKAFLKFLPSESFDEGIGTCTDIDAHSQPGGDLDFYLHDLKFRTSSARSCYNADTYSESVTEAKKLREFLWSSEEKSNASPWPPTVYRDSSSAQNSEVTLPTSTRVKSSDSRRPKSRRFSGRSISSRTSGLAGRPVSSRLSRDKLEINNVGIRTEPSSLQRPMSSKPSSAKSRQTYSELTSEGDELEPRTVQAVRITRATSPKVQGAMWDRVNMEEGVHDQRAESVASSLINEQDLEIGVISSEEDEDEMQLEEWAGISAIQELDEESDTKVKSQEDNEKLDDTDVEKLDAMVEREEAGDQEEQRADSKGSGITQPLMPPYSGIVDSNEQFGLEKASKRVDDIEVQSTEDGLSVESPDYNAKPLKIEINVRPTSRLSNRSGGSRSKTPLSSARSASSLKLEKDPKLSSRKSSTSSHRSKEARQTPPSPVPAPPSSPVPANLQDEELIAHAHEESGGQWPIVIPTEESQPVVVDTESNKESENVATIHPRTDIESDTKNDNTVTVPEGDVQLSSPTPEVISHEFIDKSAEIIEDTSNLPDSANEIQSPVNKDIDESDKVLKQETVHDSELNSSIKQETLVTFKEREESPLEPSVQSEVKVEDVTKRESPTLQKPESRENLQSILKPESTEKPSSEVKPESTRSKVTISNKPQVMKKQEPKKTQQRPVSVVKKGKPDKKVSQNQEKKKQYTSVLNITSVQPDPIEDDDPLKALDSIKTDLTPQPYVPPPPPAAKKVEPEKKVDVPEHMKELMKRDEELSKKELETQMQLMNEVVESTLGGTSVVQPGMDGMTQEDFEEAERLLKEKLTTAEEKLEEIHGSPRPKTREKKNVAKKQASQSPKVTKRKQQEIEKIKSAEKEAIKEKKKQERLRRIQEAQVLQAQIASKEAEIRAQEYEAERKQKDFEEEVKYLEREAEEIREAEEQAKIAMAEARKIAREEREKRRKEDLERKKQGAIQRREREKKMLDHARKMEQDMLDNIADADMRSRLEDEEQRKKYEEERLAEEKFEEELRLAQKMADEDEERMRELERQAEEEAMKRLEDEMLEKENRRRELELEKQRVQEEEERILKQKMEEQMLLENERRKKEELAEQKREEDRQRLRQIQQMEAEARERMRAELEKKREDAVKRRDVNLERKSNLDKVRHSQGMTKSWEFSYHVQWPRETYEQLMGAEPEKKKRGFRPKPKTKPKAT